MKTNLGSIETELALCRKVWNENPEVKMAWCCHHAVLIEPLMEPFENRIKYILNIKPENERATRLRNFRPVRIELPEKLNKAYIKWNKIYSKWNKVYSKLNKACVEYDKACVEYDKACVEYNKARVEYNKAYAEYDKAYLDRSKACEEYDKVCAKLDKELTGLHNQDWPDNTWNGKDIF